MIIRGLKTKLFFVYGILALIMCGLSLSFILTLANLSKTIDSLIEANYRSIVAARNMIEALGESQQAILRYTLNDEASGLEAYAESDRYFMTWFTKASGNITEKGEGEIIKRIQSSYEKYSKAFLQLQQNKSEWNGAQNLGFYNDIITKAYEEAKANCMELLALNENSMLRSKDDATQSADRSIYTIIGISSIAIVFALSLTAYLLVNILKPLHGLINAVKSIKAGDLNREIDIKTNDEIGELAQEFNSMTRRLQHYDQMNIKKLIEEKNKSIAIVNSISDPIIVTDEDFKLMLINPACEEVFDIKQDRVLDRHILEVIDNRAIFQLIAQAVKGGYKIQKGIENIIFLKVNDKEHYYNVIVTPILDKEDSIIGVVTIMQDVTHLKEVERMKSEFVSTVSHEFRTPLTSISMGVGLLLDGTLGEINQDQREIIAAIRDEGAHLAHLVNDLLDLSKMESGKMEMNIVPCHIDDTILAVARSFSELAASKKIDLSCDLRDILPEVYADPEKISVVLANLIGNALKFTPEGGKVDVFTKTDDQNLYVSVKDNGIGIPKEYHDKIFEKFVQVKKDINDSMGTGLGLAIAKKIIENHNGRIWVESEEGKGSTFTFTLPRTKFQQTKL